MKDMMCRDSQAVPKILTGNRYLTQCYLEKNGKFRKSHQAHLGECVFQGKSIHKK